MSTSDWAALPDELLDSILERLVLVSDYLHFSLVCSSWNYAAKESKAKIKMKSSYNRPPLLLISSSTEEGENTFHAYNFVNDKVLNLQLEMPNVRFCGSSKGWLIYVDENFAVILINPFFRVKGTRKKENSIIQLPPLRKEEWEKDFEHHVFRATISADPTLNPHHCFVAVVYCHLRRLAVIRLGQDTNWTYIDQKWDVFRNVAIVQETCYALRRLPYNNNLVSFEVATGNSFKTKKKLRDNFCSDIVRVAPKVPQDPPDLSSWDYLVDSTDGKFLMVRRYNIDLRSVSSQVYERKTWNFVVYELELQSEKSDKLSWKKKNTLGDIAIFLGDNSSVSVVASHFPGCQPNCIYFNQDFVNVRRKVDESGIHDFGIYNLEDEKVHVGVYNVQDKMSSHLSALLKKTNRLPIWVVPTFQM